MPFIPFSDTDIETKKLMDELVAWDSERDCFETSVERQLEIISKLDDKQKAYLKNYLGDDGSCYVYDLDLKIIKQLMINKIFPYHIFYLLVGEPDRQLFILENLDCDKDAKQALSKTYKTNYNFFSGCRETVLKKIKEVLGTEVDKKISYEYLISLFDPDTYTKNNKELYNSAVYVNPNGNCTFFSRIQALENKKLDYNDELNQKIIKLRQEVSEDYKQNHKYYGHGVFNQETYTDLKNNYSYCESNIVGAYFAKKYKRKFFEFNFSDGNCKCRYDDNTGKLSGEEPKLLCNSENIKSYKDVLFDFINGCPSTVRNQIHCQTLIMGKEQRKQFFGKFIRLRFYYDVCEYLFSGGIDSLSGLFEFSYVLLYFRELFCLSNDQEEKFKSQLKSYFDLIPQKFKARKTFELSKFMIEKFIELVIEPENINITAEEFFSKVLEDFKTENLDKDQDIKLELEAAKKREENKNMEEQNKNNADETKKFIDELVAWNYRKISFKFSVQECLNIIPKLDETQRQQLKEYFRTIIGWNKLKKLGFDVMKQLIKHKAFPYKYFYKFKDKPDFQIFMLENINNDQNLKDELIFDGCFIDICMCNESVLNKFKQITGSNVDLKMSYENLIKYWSKDMHIEKICDLSDNYTTNVKADGNCPIYSLIQANENIIIKDYNSKLEQKVVSLREEAANDYKQSSGSLFTQWIFDELRTNYVDCKPRFVVPYFSKKYQKNFFYFDLGGYDQNLELPSVYFAKPSGKTENNIKNMLIDFLNGAPAITSDYRHCKTINTDRNKRKEFVIKFLKLNFYSGVRYSLINRNDDIKIFDFNIASYWLDLLFGLDKNQKQKFEEQLVSYFEKIPLTHKAGKIFELKKFLIEKFIELVIKPENINITAEEFFSKVLEDFRTENLAKEQDFAPGLREKFANPNKEIKNPDPKNQSQTQTQTKKPDIQKEEITTPNSKPPKSKDPKSEKIEPKPGQNQNSNLKPKIINNDENNEIDLNLVRNSMLFVSVILGNNKAYGIISKMSDNYLKNFYRENKLEINNMAMKIRDDSKIKEFLKENSVVQDIIKLDKSKMDLLNNKLNEKNSKTWIISLSGGGVVSVSLGVAAICTFFSGLVIFPGLAIASGTIGLPTLALTCYKLIDNKIKQNIKSGPFSLLNSNQMNNLIKKINIGRAK